MSAIEPPVIVCEPFTPAYNARLERAGAYFEREKRDEAYNRSKRVERAKIERDRKRESRALDRTNREHDEAQRRKNARVIRREAIRSHIFTSIRNRVMAEHKIRPIPPKTAKSFHRWKDRLGEAMEADTEYLALRDRSQRFDRLMDRIKARQPGVAAGILARDDRATRHRKVREYRERVASKPIGISGQ